MVIGAFVRVFMLVPIACSSSLFLPLLVCMLHFLPVKAAFESSVICSHDFAADSSFFYLRDNSFFSCSFGQSFSLSYSLLVRLVCMPAFVAV